MDTDSEFSPACTMLQPSPVAPTVMEFGPYCLLPTPALSARSWSWRISAWAHLFVSLLRWPGCIGVGAIQMEVTTTHDK